MTTNSATAFLQPLDPTDYSDYVAEFGPQLSPGETIVGGFTVSPTTEGAALGLEIASVIPPALEVGELNVVFWLEVNSTNWDDVIFDDDGVQIPIEVTVTTNTTRRIQRSFLITVKHL